MNFILRIPRVIRKKQEDGCISIEIKDNFNISNALKDILGERFQLLFNDDGSCKGFAKVFHNDKCIDNLHEISLTNNDELEIITSMSGG